MIDCFCDGEFDAATARFLDLQELFATLFLEPNPVPVKAALRLVGIDVGEPRLPLVSAQEATITALQDALDSVRSQADQ
jgi:4-hydroxy-tetrahydrodipicolinate synthase